MNTHDSYASFAAMTSIDGEAAAGAEPTPPVFYRDIGMSKAQLQNLREILLKKCSGIIETSYPFKEKEVRLNKMFEEAVSSQRSLITTRYDIFFKAIGESVFLVGHLGTGNRVCILAWTQPRLSQSDALATANRRNAEL